MVKLEFPAAVPEATVRVSVLLPVPGEAILAGEKLAVTPCGKPVTANATTDLNPLSADEEKVAFPELPETMLTEFTLWLTVRLGGAVTVNAMA